MKKLLLATLLATAGIVAHAEVQVYGVLDLTVIHAKDALSENSVSPSGIIPGVSATKAATVNKSVTGLVNGGEQASRFGIKGSEDLGNGTKAIFTLESALDVNSGSLANGSAALAQNSGPAGAPNLNSSASAATSLNGQLFSRQAWAGLTDAKFGTVIAGRVYLPEYDIATGYDPLMGSQQFSPIGYSGTIGGGGGVTDVMRSDNTVRYTSPTLFGAKVGGSYKFGGVAGNVHEGSGYALNAGYTFGPFAVDAAYQNNKDAIKAAVGTVANTISGTAYDIDSVMIAGKYTAGKFTVSAGAEQFKLKAATDNMSGVTSYEGQQAVVSSYTGATQVENVYFFGGNYQVTPKITVSAGFYDQNPKAYGTTAAGKIYTYSALASYAFSKQTDVYAGLSQSEYKGLYSEPTYNTSNTVVGTGLRVRF